MTGIIDLAVYRDRNGRAPFTEWLDGLDAKTGGRVTAYVNRMRCGNFGVSRTVGDGVFELKMDFGPGYRVYFLHDDAAVVILLCGGDKGTQGSDIRKARDRAADHRRRR